ncbi:PREDICTED: glutathione S-transferase T3-like [Camelina sativa]|uniref:Glutathione S-transferase T3-like n=1 Tax=Camelina sativa TaxID=90675 RepID=A0ABM0Y6K6_CAMSA|nr:PREDICTED: glutathione S-transferase T3-like [Camelina sativa]
MESNHDLNQSTNFVGLMNIPLFSSQVSSAASPSEDTTASRRERRKWTPYDDRILISGWLNTSKDAVKGNDQKGKTFWNRVANYFSDSPLSDGNEKIGPIQCKQRWAKIQNTVGKFWGTYAAAVRAKTSELRYNQKWCGSVNGKAPEVTNKKRLFDDPAQSSASQTGGNIDEPTNTRPTGRDASKAKQRKTHIEAKEEKALKEYQGMWEIKKEELLLKERLSKMQILDCLLAKSGPLTPKEESMKEKLLDLVDD